MKLKKLVISLYIFSHGAGAFATDISSEHLLRLGNLCKTKYSKYNNYSGSNSYDRSSSASMNVNILPVGGYGGAGFSSSYNSSSDYERIKNDISERDCDKIMSSYFDYLGDIAKANTEKDVGLANADAKTKVGVAQSEALEKIGVTTAKASERVGVMNAKSNMYQAIAGAAGNVLGSLFSTGNQKAAAKAMAQAEIEKEKIRAATELKKAQMEHEIRMVSYQPVQTQNHSHYQRVNSSRIDNHETTYNKSTRVQYEQGNSVLVANEYQIPTKSRENRSYLASSNPNQIQQLNSFNDQYAAQNPQSSKRTQSISRMNPVSTKDLSINPKIAKYAQQNSLVSNQHCQRSVIIRLSNGDSGCFYPKPYLPAGIYTLNASKLTKS